MSWNRSMSTETQRNQIELTDLLQNDNNQFQQQHSQQSGQRNKKTLKDLNHRQRLKLFVAATAGVTRSSLKAADAASGDVVDGTAVEDTYAERVKWCPPPIFILLISISEIGLYFLPMPQVQNPLIYNPCRRYEAWRYVTYIYVHNSVSHLVVNMIVQILIGTTLQLVHRYARVPVIYFAGALAGCLLQSVINGRVFVAGASGAVFALLGARIANVMLNWREMGTIQQLLPAHIREEFDGSASIPLAPIQIIWCIALVLALVASDIVNGLQAASSGVSVAFGAHYGGLGAGILLGLLILVNVVDEKWERIVRIISGVLLGIYVIVTVLINIFAPIYLTPDSPSCSSQ